MVSLAENQGGDRNRTQTLTVTLCGEPDMKTDVWKETMVEQRVTYVLEVDGQFIIIENVPARVCLETGERFFSLETVERLQQTVWGRKEPSRVIETPVFEFA
jgi:YgiT-type zinc finger domain-containing protein